MNASWTATRFDRWFAAAGWTSTPVRCPGCVAYAPPPVAPVVVSAVSHGPCAHCGGAMWGTPIVLSDGREVHAGCRDAAIATLPAPSPAAAPPPVLSGERAGAFARSRDLTADYVPGKWRMPLADVQARAAALTARDLDPHERVRVSAIQPRVLPARTVSRSRARSAA